MKKIISLRIDKATIGEKINSEDGVYHTLEIKGYEVLTGKKIPLSISDRSKIEELVGSTNEPYQSLQGKIIRAETYNGYPVNILK
tara:strand:+ start:56 stop:310 length:255 start_codon:yes stop_codon:yes gene_type:complete